MEKMTKIFPLSETGEFQSLCDGQSPVVRTAQTKECHVSRIPDSRKCIMKPDRVLDLVEGYHAVDV